MDGSPRTPRSRTVNLELGNFRPSFEYLISELKNVVELSDIQAISEDRRSITFKTCEGRDKFLQLSSIKVGSNDFDITDYENGIVTVTVADAPVEMADAAVIVKLSQFGHIYNYWRGTYRNSEIENGKRLVRMKLYENSNVPSHLQIGRDTLRVSHKGQLRTCWRCDSVEHAAADCNLRKCHNCGDFEHTKRECPNPTVCIYCECPHEFSECPFIELGIAEAILKANRMNDEDETDETWEDQMEEEKGAANGTDDTREEETDPQSCWGDKIKSQSQQQQQTQTKEQQAVHDVPKMLTAIQESAHRKRNSVSKSPESQPKNKRKGEVKGR